MACSNTNKTDLIADSLRSQFTFSEDVVNPSMVDIVNTEVEKYLNTSHDNILNPATPSQVISYIGNLKKEQISRPRLHLYLYALAFPT